MTWELPGDDDVRAGRAVLMDVLTILGKYRDGMVLIGGWVPEVLFPGRGHVGSFDVDFALDGRKIPPDAYESIRQRLIAEGYVQLAPHIGVFTKNLGDDAGTMTVKLDLVTGDEPGGTAAGASVLIQDLSVVRLRGVELALERASTVTLTGVLPSGEENTVTARIVTVPAYLCLKAFALDERKKAKDAYDVYFCLKEYMGGSANLARECRELLSNERGREAMTILRGKFGTLNSVGPQWAADVAAGQGEDREGVVRDAFERASALFRALDGEAGP